MKVHRSSRLRLFALLFLAPLIAAGTAAGLVRVAQTGSEEAEEKDEDAPVYLDPRADRILWSMSQHLANAKAFRVRVQTLKDEAHPSGQWVQVSTSAELSIHRERGIRSSERGDLEDREFWTDLKTAAMLDPDSGLYALVEVPNDLDGAIDHLIDEYGVTWPLADLAYTDPYVGLIESVDVGTYVGLHQAGGVDCHHLAFKHGKVDWQIWIDAGIEPVPRKVVITYNGSEGAPRYMAFLSDWEFDPYLPEAIFQFEAPEGSKQIEVESIRED